MTAAAPAQHVIVIHRWRDGGALYEPYLDHLAVDVSYIVTPSVAASVPRSVSAVEVVQRTDDLTAVANAAGRLRQRLGPPTRIVALAAADLDVAAELRVLLGCAGETPRELAALRDRHAMLSALAAAGIRVPRFGVVSQGSDVFRLLAEQPEPVLLTPRFGTAADLGLLVETPADAERLGGLLAEPMLARAHDPAAPRYSVDGVWDGSRLLRWRAARFLQPTTGGQLAGWRGSVELGATGTEPERSDPAGSDPAGSGTELPGRLADFARATLSILLDRPAVVHVVVSASAPAGAEPRLTFGWASTGMTGVEVPLLWREVHGVDLAAAAIASQLGEPLPALPQRPAAGPDEVGGWLQVVAPLRPPCRVAAIELPSGEPGPYAAVLARVGERIPVVDPVVASLRYRAADSGRLAEALRAAAEGIRVRCTPL